MKRCKFRSVTKASSDKPALFLPFFIGVVHAKLLATNFYRLSLNSTSAKNILQYAILLCSGGGKKNVIVMRRFIFIRCLANWWIFSKVPAGSLSEQQLVARGPPGSTHHSQ